MNKYEKLIKESECEVEGFSAINIVAEFCKANCKSVFNLDFEVWLKRMSEKVENAKNIE